MVFYALTYARALYFLFQTFYLINILKWDVATIALSHLVSGYCTGRGNNCHKSYFLLVSCFLQQMTQKFHCWIFLHENNLDSIWFLSHKTSASLCSSKYVQLQPRILITCVYHNREKINKTSVDWFFTSIPVLSSAEINHFGNHIFLFLNI